MFCKRGARGSSESLGGNSGSPNTASSLGLCRPLVLAAFSPYATGSNLFLFQDELPKLIYLHSHLLSCSSWTDLYFCGIVVSWGCYNEVPHTCWLKTPQIFSVTCRAVRSLKSGINRAPLLLEDLGTNLLSLSAFIAADISYGCITPVSTSVVTLPPLSLSFVYLLF